MGIELNNQQIYCIYDLEHWWRNGIEQKFEISGSPGTGKTTIIRYFIERLNLKESNVLFVAFTGKAVSVMQRNGLPAKTIHSAIYDYKEKIARDENNEIIFLSSGKPKLEHSFELKVSLGKKVKLIVVDEGSMVNPQIGEDLMSFGVPIIVLGDLNQLPPVFGKSFFLENPNVILTQIMRQAEGNPIIWLSQEILKGHSIDYGVYGTSSVIRKSDLNDSQFRRADMIITGTNRLRYNINNYCREHIKGIKKLEYPHIGEKLVCRKNNWNQRIDKNIFLTNGTTGFVDFIYRDSYNKKTMRIDFRPDYTTKIFKNVEFDYNHLYEVPGDPDPVVTPFAYLYDKMEFGYAITCHSSQGDAFDNVLYLHENFMQTRDDNNRLMYTAITRARNSVVVVI